MDQLTAVRCAAEASIPPGRSPVPLFDAVVVRSPVSAALLALSPDGDSADPRWPGQGADHEVVPLDFAAAVPGLGPEGHTERVSSGGKGGARGLARGCVGRLVGAWVGSWVRGW